MTVGQNRISLLSKRTCCQFMWMSVLTVAVPNHLPEFISEYVTFRSLHYHPMSIDLMGFPCFPSQANSPSSIPYSLTLPSPCFVTPGTFAKLSMPRPGPQIFWYRFGVGPKYLYTLHPRISEKNSSFNENPLRNTCLELMSPVLFKPETVLCFLQPQWATEAPLPSWPLSPLGSADRPHRGSERQALVSPAQVDSWLPIQRSGQEVAGDKEGDFISHMDNLRLILKAAAS